MGETRPFLQSAGGNRKPTQRLQWQNAWVKAKGKQPAVRREHSGGAFQGAGCWESLQRVGQHCWQERTHFFIRIPFREGSTTLKAC